MERAVSVLFGAMALFAAYGALQGWPNIFGENGHLMNAGTTLLLAYTCFNPQMLLKPLRFNPLKEGQHRWLGFAGLGLVSLGIIEFTGVFSTAGLVPSGTI